MVSQEDLQTFVTLAESIAKEIEKKFNVDQVVVTHNENWNFNANEIFISMPDHAIYESEEYQEYIALKSGYLFSEHPEISWYFNNGSEPEVM